MKNVTVIIRCSALLIALAGCGSTKSRLATDQLLMSDAVDRTVSAMDYSPLANKRVYFDTKYVQPIKGYVFVNAEYVISSLRQQMLAAGCLLQDKLEDAEYIVEARVGALGTDSHEVTYGFPANQSISEAASLIPATPRLPMIPEIAFAKKTDSRGAAKIAVFAYHRQTREPVWQSGIAVATSSAKEAWVFGAGPIRYGTIYDNNWMRGKGTSTQMAYSKDNVPEGRMASYYGEMDFQKLHKEQQTDIARQPALPGQLRKLPKVSNAPSPETPSPGPPASHAVGAGAGTVGNAPTSALPNAVQSSGRPAAATLKLSPPSAAPHPVPPDAYPFPPGLPPLLPNQPPLTSDQFPGLPQLGMLLMDPAQITSDQVPSPFSGGMILMEPLPLTSDKYPQPGPQAGDPPAPPPPPPALPFILQ
ncbi:MAG: hypothetical protein NTY19_42950 [Planctomycetota bacterium]|nr:hypothetical protein [Planctomycetota bacterium]